MNEHPILAAVRAALPNLNAPFVLIVDVKAKQGRGDDFAKAVAQSQTVRMSRLEPGCKTYDISRDAQERDRFLAYEQWRDFAALQAHFATAHFAAVGEAMGALLAEPPVVRVMTLLE